MRERFIAALEGLELEIFTLPGLKNDAEEVKKLQGKIKTSLELAREGRLIASLAALEVD